MLIIVVERHRPSALLDNYLGALKKVWSKRAVLSTARKTRIGIDQQPVAPDLRKTSSGADHAGQTIDVSI